MACWTASEVWQRQWPANGVAWAATALALLAVAMHSALVKSQHAAGDLPGWHYRFAQGAIAIATVAVLFSALPSVVFLP